MQANQIPAKFPVPWGNSAGNGYIRNIPTASQQGITAGAASLADGFPPICFTAVGSGGIPPSGQDFNGILAQITAWNRWQAAGGTVPYDSTFSTAVSGYPVGAILQSTTAGLLWLNTADGNTTNPDGTNPTGWIAILTSSSASAQTGAQAAKSPFNTVPLPTNQRTSVSNAQGAGVLYTVVPGLSFVKRSPTSVLRIQGSFYVHSPVIPGQGNGAVTVRAIVTSAGSGATFYDDKINNSTFLVSGGGAAGSGGNSPRFRISGIPAGACTLSIAFKRDDNLAWSAIFGANGSDLSGLPTPNPSLFDIDEVEPT
ncbi:hypothetical protein ACQKQD_18650 [Methylobacterium sp. NPDC080182]|uniref:hypothetical protein n=1 Tax=Methylobacterium sp. NPDC080182 TaxID=3390590 RepID=UPI003D04DDD9